jgi:hypothetical protein
MVAVILEIDDGRSEEIMPSFSPPSEIKRMERMLVIPIGRRNRIMTGHAACDLTMPPHTAQSINPAEPRVRRANIAPRCGTDPSTLTAANQPTTLEIMILSINNSATTRGGVRTTFLLPMAAATKKKEDRWRWKPVSLLNLKQQ